MTTVAQQLSLVDVPQVGLTYHRDLQPPNAAGPEEYGVFAATFAELDLCGWGRTTDVALNAPACCLRSYVLDHPRVPTLTAAGQALVAAELLDDSDLVRWLAQHTSEPELYEAPRSPV